MKTLSKRVLGVDKIKQIIFVVVVGYTHVYPIFNAYLCNMPLLDFGSMILSPSYYTDSYMYMYMYIIYLFDRPSGYLWRMLIVRSYYIMSISC